MIDARAAAGSWGAALLLALTAAAATPSSTAAASPSDVVQTPTFGVRPAHEGQTTLPGGHFSFSLAPGQTLSDAVVVENLSDHALEFHVYGADVHSASGGGLAPAQFADKMRAAGAWITIGMPVLTVAAHSEVTEPFRLSVPLIASTGEHVGAVVTAANVGTTAQGSIIEARTALLTVVTVPGSLSPSASLGPLRRAASGPQPFGFEIALTNTGNLQLTYAGWVVVSDGAGGVVASLPLTPTDASVIPAGQVSLTAAWPTGMPHSGAYTAQATVTIIANGVPVATLTSNSLDVALPSSGDLPLPAGIGAVVLAILLAVVAWLRRSRRLRVRARHIAEVTNLVGERQRRRARERLAREHAAHEPGAGGDWAFHLR